MRERGKVKLAIRAIGEEGGIAIDGNHQRAVLAEYFRVEGPRTQFDTIDEMQKVLDDYLVTYNTKRPQQGRDMNGRTPINVFKAGLPKLKPQKEEKSPPQKTDRQLAA